MGREAAALVGRRGGTVSGSWPLQRDHRWPARDEEVYLPVAVAACMRALVSTVPGMTVWH